MWEAINFRPKESDEEVISLIVRNHPVVATSGTEVIRQALAAYWELYGPGQDGLPARTKRLEQKVDKIIEALGVDITY